MSAPHHIMLLVTVGAGGAIGAMLRYAIGLLVLRVLDPRVFPLATLLVNWIGCFTIGWLASSFLSGADAGHRARAFWMTGVLGGFTTFSAFSLEMATLLAQQRPGAAAVYFVLSCAGCVLLAMLGLRLGA